MAGQHARTPGIVADMALGIRFFLDFAQEARALTAKEASALWDRGWHALSEVAAEQADHISAARTDKLLSQDGDRCPGKWSRAYCGS